MRTNNTDSSVITMKHKHFYDISLNLCPEPSQKRQSDILVLVRHVKNLVHYNAMRYQLFMALQGAIYGVI